MKNIITSSIFFFALGVSGAIPSVWAQNAPQSDADFFLAGVTETTGVIIDYCIEEVPELREQLESSRSSFNASAKNAIQEMVQEGFFGDVSSVAQEDFDHLRGGFHLVREQAEAYSEALGHEQFCGATAQRLAQVTEEQLAQTMTQSFDEFKKRQAVKGQ